MVVSFAEISIGIIVGCMPLVHKFFKHFSLKISSTSSFKRLSNSSGGSSWRRLFGKASGSEASASQKFFDSQGAGSVAPHIETLNMTRVSFSSTDKELSTTFSATERDHVKLPQPVLDKGLITRKPGPQDIDENYIPGKLDDEENVNTAPETTTQEQHIRVSGNVQSWQPHEWTRESRINETNRAQYDLYPRSEGT